ncbi:hypothetical protein I7I51_06307 [Histoplasma capsulatum]|uniref:Uncharacterized protein n=1 Tax=Ajellomyces capsulatus TaxID=5037 RepID=A0A8A1MLC4_AJECA|nr:predicted protein [Histoplasma mississippiense (nom. inval.)]EDN05926.1 predicted protein [Histoplasma mississippiense (nom. inval.)]QSS65464.1 hypothetical protein I7I51_06307 [Histoplasma capsulatum]
MADNCWYRPSFVGSASNVPFFTTFQGDPTSQRRIHHRIVKTTSADNSPSRIGKRDMMFNRCHGQRRVVRNSMRELSFHSALLRAVPRESPASSLPSPTRSNVTYPNIRPPSTCQDGTYEHKEMLMSPAYMNNNGLYTQEYATNHYGCPTHPQMEFPHYQLDISHRNSIYIMESLSSDPPTTNYLLSSTCYSMPLANDMASISTAPTALSTPDNPPTHNHDSEPETPPLVPDRDEPGEELVGVGLYDKPEELPQWDYSMDNYLRLGNDTDSRISLKTSGGKGLKLEETFDPDAVESSQDDDSDDEESRDKSDMANDQGNGDDDDCIRRRASQEQDEISTPEDPKLQVEQKMQPFYSPFETSSYLQQNEPWIFSSQQHDPENSPVYHLDMAGKSFYFQDEQNSDFVITKSNQQSMTFPSHLFGASYTGSVYG